MERARIAQAAASLVAPQSAESNAELQRSAGLLSGSAGRGLATLMAQMVSHYPHQELGEETLMSYTHDLARMAQQHGLLAVKTALLAIRIRPGQKFFPHPTEVAEELEAMAAKRLEAERKEHPYVPDPECKHVPGGYFRRTAGGVTECACYLRWRGLARPAVEDRKSVAAGQ